MRNIYGALVLIFTSMLAGCQRPRATEVARERTHPTPAAAVPAPSAPAGAQLETPLGELEKLQQVEENGPGLVVCEPVARGADRAALEFSAGAARWLQFHASGQMEFGRTPLYSVVDAAREEMKRRDLRLSRKEAASLARRLGISHAVVGEVAGNSRTCRITFQVVAVPSLKPLGSIIALEGGFKAIRARLPQAARTMCGSLGVSAPQFIPREADSVEDLRLGGRLPWLANDTVSLRDVRQLEARQARSALLFLHLITNRSIEADGEYLQDTDLMFDQLAPGNPVALAELGRWSNNAKAKRSISNLARIEKGLEAHPNHFLLNAARTYALREKGEFEAAALAARRAVRCASRNPQAWLLLNGTYQNWHNAVRQGRFGGDLSPQEAEMDQRLSVASLETLAQAAELNPGARIYTDLSNAAAFCGDAELARASFWHAVEQEPENPEVWQWGLQLFHPKWLDDRKEARRVVDRTLAAARRYGSSWSFRMRVFVAERCYLLGFQQEAMRVAGGTEERANVLKLVKDSPEQVQ